MSVHDPNAVPVRSSSPSAHAPHAAAPAIGVDLGGTKIEAIVLDPHGASLWRERVATPAGDYGATLDTVAALAWLIERTDAI